MFSEKKSREGLIYLISSVLPAENHVEGAKTPWRQRARWMGE